MNDLIDIAIASTIYYVLQDLLEKQLMQYEPTFIFAKEIHLCEIVNFACNLLNLTSDLSM